MKTAEKKPLTHVQYLSPSPVGPPTVAGEGAITGEVTEAREVAGEGVVAYHVVTLERTDEARSC